MKYKKTRRARFISRPNRFIANVEIDGVSEIVHVKNTGRCKEIFVEGTTVILEESDNLNRKTKYSIIAGCKGELLINTDSQVPNTVVYEALKNNKIKEIQKDIDVKREVAFGNSRFDLYFENRYKKGFIEVKGVTLEHEGICKFPDAPTLRGTKHIYEMMDAVQQGYLGYIFFLVQMEGMKHFTPNDDMDPKFGAALRTAEENGVKILVYDSMVTEDAITIGKKLPYIL